MHPIHDVDVVVLMAATLSSKRRPAELLEIVAATDLIQGFVPTKAKFIEAFARLSGEGLLGAGEGGFTLTPAAERIMATLPRKADTAQRIALIKDELADYRPAERVAPIVLSDDQVGAAIRAHQASAPGAGKNMLMPKPKAEEADKKRPGPWRKFSETRRRRS